MTPNVGLSGGRPENSGDSEQRKRRKSTKHEKAIRANKKQTKTKAAKRAQQAGSFAAQKSFVALITKVLLTLFAQ